MRNNSMSLLSSVKEVEESLLSKPTNVYLSYDFQTNIELDSIPCKIVATSPSLSMVRLPWTKEI